jgi:hypothetical protein
MCHIQWFFRKPDDEKLKRNEEGDVDLYSEPSLCLSLLSFFPCIIGLAEEPYFITSHLDAIALPNHPAPNEERPFYPYC